jgi:dihydroneopterin aldolase
MVCSMSSDWLLADALGLRRTEVMGGASTYTVFVHDLVLTCSIGVYEHEKRQLQRVRFNAELVVAEKLDPPDHLENVFNYETLVDGIRAIATIGHTNLVEMLAERIVALCFAQDRVRAVRVKIEKLDVYPDAGGVGIAIDRRRPGLCSLDRPS